MKFHFITKWYVHKAESVPENDSHKIVRDFEIQTDHLVPTRRVDLVTVKKKKERKKRTCWLLDFAVQADHRVKIKENEKRDKYLNLAWELKNQWNMIGDTNCIGALGINPKCLVSGGVEGLKIEGRVQTIKSTTLLRSAKILRRILETWGYLPSLRLQWKAIS